MMKKRIYSIMAAALLTVAGTLLTTGCSSDDAAIDNATPTMGGETIQFTATLAPKGDATTRAITVNNQGSATETLTVDWAENEQIAVYYQKSDDSYATTTATVGTPNADGSAPITATLTSPKDGGTVKFVYPATLHNGTGDIDASILRNNQVGTLADISANFDAATGSGNITITNGVTRVTATKGAAASVLVSIGMGGTTGTDNSTCGTITIGGTQYYDGTNFVNGGDTYLINSPFIYEP